jgi:predicted anti-sigma-YlaC factor YlaD
MTDTTPNCDEIVELVTDYLEGVLGEAVRVRFEEHLAECPGCLAYVDQIRTTVALTGRVRADDLSIHARRELVAAFRSFRR